MTATALIAIDWGTTSARAYRVDAAGGVLATREAPLGIQRVRDGGFAGALGELLGDWQDDPAPRIACGMIGSRQGWVEAPYVACPAHLPDLAAGIVHVPEARLAVVPGVRTRDAYDVPDVMRGEETQLAGVVRARDERVLCALPGTHAKWACVDAGRLVDFVTFMTGEIWDVLLKHSILGRLVVPGPEEGGPGPAFARGVARGLGPGNLAHDAFGARTLALAGELRPGEVTEWLSGLLVGREIRDARRWAEAGGDDASEALVIGGDALAARYSRALARAGIRATTAPPDAAAAGVFRIARAAGRVAVETA